MAKRLLERLRGWFYRNRVELALSFCQAWNWLGLTYSYIMRDSAEWMERYYEKYYFVWAKAADLLFVCCLILLLYFPRPRYAQRWREMFILLGIFYVIRLAWEALAIPNYKFASSLEVIDALLVLCLTSIIVEIFLFLRNDKSE